MSAASPVGTVDRVCLNLRVSKSVKEAYEDVVVEKYGRKRPYAGIELEREFRFALDRGSTYDLYDSIKDLADAFGKVPAEKENYRTPDDERVVVAYRVAEPIRNGIMSLASGESCDSPGEFVERLMQAYATGESVEERLIELTNQIKQATEYQFDDDLSAVEKRKKGIADELGDVFTLSEFGDAIESGTRGLSVKSIKDYPKTRRSYLPKVLDEKGATWHPEKPGKFVPADHVIPEERRDPRNKPHILMDESDVRLALKYHAHVANLPRSDTGTLLGVSDAVSVLDGNKSRDKVNSALRAIGETDGFTYKSGRDRRGTNADDVLVHTDRDAVETSPDHERLRKALPDDPRADDTDAGTVDELDADDPDELGGDHVDTNTDTDDTPAVDHADGNTTDLTDDDLATIAADLPDGIDDYPDTILANKIIRHTEDIDHYDELPADPEDAVPDEQLSRVRRYVDNDTEEPGTTGPRGRVDADQTPMDTPDMDAGEDMDEIAAAEPVRTDGGTPEGE